MEAIEFKSKIKNGIIQIPKKYKQKNRQYCEGYCNN
jgi:hypothetical protein